MTEVFVPDPEFDSVFQSTFALVFFGEKITQIRRTRKSERPPATEFVTRFIYPSPIIRPTEIAAKKEKNLELIYKEDCKSDHYFGQYARIIDRGKFIVYFPKNGELNVVDDETVEFELRHKI